MHEVTWIARAARWDGSVRFGALEARVGPRGYEVRSPAGDWTCGALTGPSAPASKPGEWRSATPQERHEARMRRPRTGMGRLVFA